MLFARRPLVSLGHVTNSYTDTASTVAGDRSRPTDYKKQTGIVWDLAAAAGEPNAIAPDEKELLSLWDDLRGNDAAKAYRAVWRLASHPKVAVPFLKIKSKDVPIVNDTVRLAARPFDPDLVLSRRLVEAVEHCDSPDSLELLRELAALPAFKAPASAAVSRRTLLTR